MKETLRVAKPIQIKNWDKNDFYFEAYRKQHQWMTTDVIVKWEFSGLDEHRTYLREPFTKYGSAKNKVGLSN